MRTDRYWWDPPWKLTNWGFIGSAFRPQLGCDEWHNESHYVVIPLVGMFTWFPADGYNGRFGEEHVHSSSPLGLEGRVVDGCWGCEEFLADVKEFNDELMEEAKRLGDDLETRGT